MSKQKDKEDISYAFAIISASIATILAGNELANLGEYLTKDGFLKQQAKHDLKLANGAFQSWTNANYNFDKYSRTKCEDLHKVHEMCKEIASKMEQDISLFRMNIENYMRSDDIIYESSLAETYIICSLLHFAIEICNLVKVDESTLYYRTLRIMQPHQIMANVRAIYNYLPLPNDFEVVNSENCNACISSIAEKITHYYAEYFLEKEK